MPVMFLLRLVFTDDNFIVKMQTGRTKKFVLYINDNVGKLAKAYVKEYQNKGCTSVCFYRNGSLLNENTSFFAQGVKDKDTLIAMENGKSL